MFQKAQPGEFGSEILPGDNMSKNSQKTVTACPVVFQAILAESAPEGAKGVGGAQIASPPPDDMGVMFQNSGKVPAVFRFHWLTFTVFEEPSRAKFMVLNRLLKLYDALPDEFFRLSPNGSRGYTEVYQGMGSIRIYTRPTDGAERYTIEIPGEILQFVEWESIKNLLVELSNCHIKWKVSRLDIAFDLDETSKLTPLSLNTYLRSGGDFRCPASRKTITFISPTFDFGEGVVNGSTLYIGSRSSARLVRVYDKRGFTRIEMEIKSKKATQIMRDLLNVDVSMWDRLSMSYLLDYVDFANHVYWREFVSDGVRPERKKNNFIDFTLSSTEDWITQSVAPTLAMLTRIYGLSVLDDIVRKGEVRLSERHRMMIRNANIPISGDVVGLFSEHSKKIVEVER